MVFVTITESAIRPGHGSTVSLLPSGGARRSAAGRKPAAASAGFAVAVLVLLLVQALGVMAALHTMVVAPIVMAAPLTMAAIALIRLRLPLPGPPIHDRQLDLIISLGAGGTACVLVVSQLTGTGRALGLLALAPTAVAVLAAVVGTRRLWHLRAVPTLLALAWPAPWAALITHVGAGSAAAVAVIVGVGVVAIVVACVGSRPPVALLTTRPPAFPVAQL